MTAPQVTIDLALLREHAVEDPAKPGHWFLAVDGQPRGVSRTTEATLAWIRTCHYLGCCVTDILTTEFLSSLVAKVADLERRVSKLSLL